MENNEKLLQYLLSCAKNKNLSHCYSFIGQNKSGRKVLITNFLEDFFNEEAHIHPDIQHLEPEKNIISIDSVRRARTWLSMSPIKDTKKALIIHHAETMRTEAQNALLKAIEEPIAHTYIFIIINHKEQILPTLYSRTVPLYLTSKNYKTIDNEEHKTSIISGLMREDDLSKRMRLWLASAVPKESIKESLELSLPILRKELRSNYSAKLALALRALLTALAKPVGQNWPLVAEQLIISI
jgi:DNA polymerase III delta prime subunit